MMPGRQPSTLSDARRPLEWDVLDRCLLLDASPWLSLWVERVRLPDGRQVADFLQVEQPDFAIVFGVVEPDRVLAIRHYKHGPRRVNLGLPAGYVAPGELPLAAAHRELKEETGYEADVWSHLGSFSVDGNRGCGRAHIYLALGLRKTAEPSADDLEEIEVELIHFSRLAECLRTGEVATLGAAAAIALGLNAVACTRKERVGP